MLVLPIIGPKLEGDLARLVEMHHVLNSEGNIESLLIRNAESLMVRSSAGLATLIGDAIYRHPSPKLHRIAAMVAIERGEDEIASEHLLNCNAPDLEYSTSILKERFLLNYLKMQMLDSYCLPARRPR